MGADLVQDATLGKGNLDAFLCIGYGQCMNDAKDTGKKRPKTRSDDKEARLKAALKANMARRKAQARARAAVQDQKQKGS